ncbi:hypothetical protein [Nocardioides sp. CFH 31398]|uniref:hypothetical protein n=1 Tax=Nocardioides sp. CFH 31398 TaxID=2919579 RepID=UPI001F05B7CA|nr:hypothetical protein [Nocardioides sp. CFH 31398]MCH1865627.1 hypothetical protein [Nocardioides sp. CFH 31398]
MKKLSAILLAVVLSGVLALGHASPASAGEPPPGQADWRAVRPTCAVEDGFMTIGTAAWLKEIGKHRVRGFKVQYLLYYGLPGMLNPSQRRKSFSSARFPNDAQSFSWTAPRQSWGPFVAPDQTVYLVVKATWDRVDANDWDQKFTAAVCTG